MKESKSTGNYMYQVKSAEVIIPEDYMWEYLGISIQY